MFGCIDTISGGIIVQQDSITKGLSIEIIILGLGVTWVVSVVYGHYRDLDDVLLFPSIPFFVSVFEGGLVPSSGQFR